MKYLPFKLSCRFETVVTGSVGKPVAFATRKTSTCELPSENPVWATHDFTEIRVRVLRSKDVLEKCKKGRLFLVVGAERETCHANGS